MPATTPQPAAAGKMKKFAGNKPLLTIKQQCKAQGVRFDDFLWRTRGVDTVVIGGPIRGLPFRHGDSAWVIYNTVNGRFHGCTHTGVRFDSSSTRHERQPWFQALLSFFYVEKDSCEPRATKAATMPGYQRVGVELLAA